MKKNIFKDKKVLAGGLLIIILLGAYLFYMTGNDTDITETDKENGNPQPHKGLQFLTKNKEKSFIKNQNKKEAEARTNPALENIQVTELAVADDMEIPDEEEIKKREILQKTTTSLDRALKTLPSFRFKGKMTIKIPGMNPSEEDFKKGDRYGKMVELTSNFTLKKDEQGNIHLHQQTLSDTGSTKFDQPAYNRDIYMINGKYYSYDKTGSPETGSSAQPEIDPLANKNWARILRDIYPVISFNETIKDSSSSSYEVLKNNSKKEDWTLKAENLQGDIEIEDSSAIMTHGNISGRGKLGYGYISGAQVEFKIEMDMDRIGTQPQIYLP